MHKKMTDEERETIRRMWAEGVSGSEIARTIGRSAKTVHSYAARHRDEMPRKTTDHDVSAVRRLWDEGFTMREIGATLGIPKATVAWVVSTHRKEFGYRRTAVTTREAAEMRRLKALGCSNPAIADMVGRNVDTVRKVLREELS